MRPVAFALALALAAVPALAQTPLAPAEPERRVVTLMTTAIDFTEVKVIGELERPTGDVIWTRPNVKFRNLIELRSSFRPELAHSVAKLP